MYQGSWKNAQPTFECNVLLQSRGQGPKTMDKVGDKSVPYFQKELRP